MLGLLQVDDITLLEKDLTELRKHLIADPYFAGVPSMQPETRKTAVGFHAKDDLPEVRREVFAVLSKHKDLNFFAIIRDKYQLLSYVLQRNAIDPTYRYNSNELYDYLVRRLFRDRLHTRDSYRIYFSRRGSSDRTQAFNFALNAAKERFAEKHPQAEKISEVEIEVIPAYSIDIAALQAVDYFLWSLQRLYERGEDRFISLLWPSFRLVIDMDDTRFAGYGTYYNRKKPLNLDAIKERSVGRK